MKFNKLIRIWYNDDKKFIKGVGIWHDLTSLF
jgi:hypothetical protein